MAEGMQQIILTVYVRGGSFRVSIEATSVQDAEDQFRHFAAAATRKAGSDWWYGDVRQRTREVDAGPRTIVKMFGDEWIAGREFFKALGIEHRFDELKGVVPH